MTIKNDQDAVDLICDYHNSNNDDNACFICYNKNMGYIQYLEEECHFAVSSIGISYTKCITAIESKNESFYKWLIEDSFFSYLFNQEHDWRKTNCAILEFDLKRDIVPLKIALMLTRLPWDFCRSNGRVFSLMEKIVEECDCGYWFAFLFTSFLSTCSTKAMLIYEDYLHHVPFTDLKSLKNINIVLNALSTEEKLEKALEKYSQKCCSSFIDNVINSYRKEVFPFVPKDYCNPHYDEDFVILVKENMRFI